MQYQKIELTETGVLVIGVSGKLIEAMGYIFTVTGGGGVQFLSGSAELTGVMTFDVGAAAPPVGNPWHKTVATGDPLRMALSGGTTAVNGSLIYRYVNG
jgi:hypothetical protein